MIKYIVIAETAQKADAWNQEELELPKKDCLYLGWEWPIATIQSKIRGLYKYVLEGRVRLFGMSINAFKALYTGSIGF